MKRALGVSFTFRCSGSAGAAAGLSSPASRAAAVLLGVAACSGADVPAQVEQEEPAPEAETGLEDIAPIAPEDIGPGMESSDRDLALRLVEPDHGPFAGGNQVLLRGTGFDGVTQILFGDNQVEPTFIQVIDPTRILVVAPPGEVGPVDVIVCVERDGDAGCDRDQDDAQDVLDAIAVRPAGYSYDPVRIDPGRGPASGGTLVTAVGRDTSFGPDTAVTIGGSPVEDLAVVTSTQLTFRSPPGDVGLATVVFSTDEGDLRLRSGFEYFEAVDPQFGGLGGEPVAGRLTVRVNEAFAGPIAGAFVIAGSDAGDAVQGVTGPDGAAVLDGNFVAPLAVTASAEGYSSATIESFDTSEATLWLLPIPPPPQPGAPPPPGPGQLAATLRGVIQFGGPPGIGIEDWSLVPQPDAAAGEFRCAIVDVTRGGLYWGPGIVQAGGHVCYDEVPPGSTAWPYEILSRPGTLAVYALAGICRNLVGDFCTDGPAAVYRFTPHAIGARRGVSAGPGEEVRADVVIDLPLGEELDIAWADPPPGLLYTLDVAIDLGGDGVIVRSDARQTGQGRFVIPHQAPLIGSLGDASYTIVAAAATPGFGPPSPVDGWDREDANFYGGSLPYSVRVVRGVTDLSEPIVIGDWLGVPRFVQPTLFGSLGPDRRLDFANPGATPSFNNTWLLALAGMQQFIVWWYVTEGAVTEMVLPPVSDLAGISEDARIQTILWAQWAIRIPGFDFDTFHYGHTLDPGSWEAFAGDLTLFNWR